jgi:zinc/manganese transport system substrate-binding protein
VSGVSTGRILLLAGLIAALSAAFSAAPARAQDGQQDKVGAIATTSIIADFVRNVGGNRVAVATLVGPDGDAHVYSPTPGDARTLASAAIVFVNGLGLEGWITRLVKASGTKAPVVVVSNGVTPRKRQDEDRPGRSAVDPHAWQSVANAKMYVANIRDALSAVDPTGKAAYAANAAAYLGKLDELETEIGEAIGSIPAGRRRIITTHDAFGYFGDAYGLSFIAPEGVSTEAEPAAKDIAAIIAQIRREKIPAVFLESITDPRLMQTIARETGARIGGTLYSDALSAPGGPAATYIEMMRHNLRELTKALSG